MTEELKALLEAQGINIADAAKALRELNKEATEARASMLEEKKVANKDTLITIMEETRETLANAFASLLAGTHANFTVRVSKDGQVIATANDCHAAGFRDSIHVAPDGTVCYGEEGAEAAKNVRPRKSGS